MAMTLGEELALGLVGKFWRPVIQYADLDAERYKTFAEPGWAKTVYALSVTLSTPRWTPRRRRRPRDRRLRAIGETVAMSEQNPDFSTERAREIGERIGIDWGRSRFDVEQFRHRRTLVNFPRLARCLGAQAPRAVMSAHRVGHRDHTRRAE